MCYHCGKRFCLSCLTIESAKEKNGMVSYYECCNCKGTEYLSGMPSGTGGRCG